MIPIIKLHLRENDHSRITKVLSLIPAVLPIHTYTNGTQLCNGLETAFPSLSTLQTPRKEEKTMI